MAYSYGVYGQITGRDIKQDVNIISLIDLSNNQYVSAIAIHTNPTREIYINNSKFYIGDTGTIQFYDVQINSIIFSSVENEGWPIDDNTIITFAISEKGE